MSKTFADIPVGGWCHMDIGGTRRALIYKSGPETMRFGQRLEDHKASPLWQVETLEEVAKEQRLRAAYTPVPNHSTTWPYGEH